MGRGPGVCVCESEHAHCELCDCGLLFVSSTPFFFLYSVGRSRQRVSRMSAKSQMSKLLDQLMGQNRDGEFRAVFKPILKYWPQWWNKGCDNFGFFCLTFVFRVCVRV